MILTNKKPIIESVLEWLLDGKVVQQSDIPDYARMTNVVNRLKNMGYKVRESKGVYFMEPKDRRKQEAHGE